MNAFEAYKRYLAFKLHFTTKNYNIIQYDGKVSASAVSFDKRKDKYFFHKLSKQEDVDKILIAYFVDVGGKGWVGEILSGKDTYYLKWLRRQESITYRFESDLKLYDHIKDAIICKDGQHPRLLADYLGGKVAIETLIILNDKTRLFEIWDRKIEDRMIWPKVHLKCLKYQPFVSYNKEKIHKIMVDLAAESMHNSTVTS